MRTALLAGLLGAWTSASPAQQADYLVTAGKLSSLDFYRLVACRAPPGGPCTIEMVRWPREAARDLAVGLAAVPAAYPRDLARRMSRALDDAITEINAAGSALRLTRAAKGGEPDVLVHLAPVHEGEPIRGTGVAGVDGEVIGAALVTVWWNEAMDLTRAVIVLAQDLPPADVGPVMLEEMTQAMGLMTDIRNPHYDGVSVFAEDTNSVRRLGPQDRFALRRHYPPGGRRPPSEDPA